MKLTPIKIGEDYRLRNDLLDMMVNVISRAPRMQAVDTRARVTGADRLRIRLQGLAAAKGPGLRAGGSCGGWSSTARPPPVADRALARRDVSLDGVHRHDRPGAGARRADLTATKRGDRISMDFTGSSPENDSSYNCYPHIVAAHAAIFTSTRIPSTTSRSQRNACALRCGWCRRAAVFNADPEAAISNSPTLCSLVISLTSVVMSKMSYPSADRDKVGAPNGNMGSNLLFSGMNQYGVPVAEVERDAQHRGPGSAPRHGRRARLRLPLGSRGSLSGHGGRGDQYQFLRLFFNLRRDNGGFGKYQGGAGSETAVVPRHVPQHVLVVDRQELLDHERSGPVRGLSRERQPRHLGRGTRTSGRSSSDTIPDVPRDAVELVTGRALKGRYVIENLNRTVRLSLLWGDVIVQFAGGGGGFGDVLERDPESVMADLRAGLVSEWTAEHVYRVRFDNPGIDPGRRPAAAPPKSRRHAREEQLARAKPWTSSSRNGTSCGHPTRRSPIGSWPDGVRDTPVIRNSYRGMTGAARTHLALTRRDGSVRALVPCHLAPRRPPRAGQSGTPRQ